MKAIKINNEWQKFAKIPSTFNGIYGYQYDTSRHYNDGWRDFVSPVYNAETETHTQTIIEQGTHPNKTATYEVRDLTQEELDQRAEDSIPMALTRSQLRQSLLLNGISEVDILNAINTLPSPQKELILIKWEDEQTFNRTSQDVQGIKEIMELTTDQLNNIFIQGVEL